jgi:hypothetical protein
MRLELSSIRSWSEAVLPRRARIAIRREAGSPRRSASRPRHGSCRQQHSQGGQAHTRPTLPLLLENYDVLSHAVPLPTCRPAADRGQRTPGYFAAGLAGDRHRTWTSRMTKLPMRAGLSAKAPALPLQDLDHLSYLHDLWLGTPCDRYRWSGCPATSATRSLTLSVRALAAINAVQACSDPSGRLQAAVRSVVEGDGTIDHSAKWFELTLELPTGIIRRSSTRTAATLAGVPSPKGRVRPATARSERGQQQGCPGRRRTDAATIGLWPEQEWGDGWTWRYWPGSLMGCRRALTGVGDESVASRTGR